jgi:hypothetical protein
LMCLGLIFLIPIVIRMMCIMYKDMYNDYCKEKDRKKEKQNGKK